LNAILSFLSAQGPILLYGILGFGSALENFFPPVPADTFVVIGAFLAAGGVADAWYVFFVTWGANTGAALLVYWTGYRLGRPFFQVGFGRHVLNTHQLGRLGRFYDRWGLPAIFFARFLPGLRAMVPVFAGVTHQPARVVVAPILVASGIWYGGLVWVGATAGRNLPAVMAWLAGANRFLLGFALLAVGGILIWWFRTRSAPGPGQDHESPLNSGSNRTPEDGE
jgi:membrane protein DedA with SNARE-associated domain